MVGRGSDHEGDGGWPYRNTKEEQEYIKRYRRVFADGEQDVLLEKVEHS